MKRFAAHYIFIPGSGFLKQYAIEMQGEYVYRIFPCSREMESIEWFPGVILLTSQEKPEINNALFKSADIEEQSIIDQETIGCMRCRAFLLFPFDFVTMQPVDGTQHRQLQ